MKIESIFVSHFIAYSMFATNNNNLNNNALNNNQFSSREVIMCKL
jgi:hypothetical protein